jgi:hypothetical protein
MKIRFARHTPLLLAALLSSSTFSGQALAAPQIPGSSYLPLATCNEQAVNLYQTFENGSSANPAKGLLVVSGQVLHSAVPQISEVTELKGSFATGFDFRSTNFGAVSISVSGHGRLNYQFCYQEHVGDVRCENKTLELNCRFLPEVPSGFSVGN